MEQYIGLTLLCLIPAIISVVFENRMNKIHEKKGNLKEIVFFSLMYLFVLSGMKLFLGDRNDTVIESFWDMEGKTYLHYGVPLIVLSIVCPVLANYIFKDKLLDFIDTANSVMISALFFVFYIYGKVINEVYCGIVLVGCVSAMICVVARNKKCTYFVIEKEKKLSFSLKVIIFAVFSILIFNPSELFLSNINEFPFSYGSFLTVLITGSLLVVAVYAIMTTFFLNNVCYYLCNYGIFTLTLVGYLQGMFLNGQLFALDGTRQEWSIGKIVINLCVWIVVIGIVVLLKCFCKKADKIAGAVCIYVSLIQLVSLITLCLTTEFPNAEETYALTTEGRLELHSDENVIVFILDWYDEQIIEKLVERDDEFLAPLSDFTWYQNATSNYAYTDMSVPYLLTNVEWEYDMDEKEYCKYAYSSSQFLQNIAEQNYEIGIYTDVQYVDSAVKDYVLNYSNDIVQDCEFLDTIVFMSKCSKYKMAPFIAKNFYWYSTSDIIDTMESSNVHLIDNYSFYQDLDKNGIQIVDRDHSGVFRFYHLDGAHSPCTMTADFEKVESTGRMQQAEGSMRIVYKYIEQLKQLGVYDNATIIITADHGQNIMLDNPEGAAAEGFEQTSNPILFVKEKGQAQMNISRAPVSHQEFAATVLQAITGNKEGYGDTFAEIKDTEQKEREFIVRRHDDIPYQRYIIRGDVGEWSNWTLVEDMRK